MQVEINYKTKKYETIGELHPGQCFEVVGYLERLFIFTNDYCSFVDLKDGTLHTFDEYSDSYSSETPVIIRNDLKITDK